MSKPTTHIRFISNETGELEEWIGEGRDVIGNLIRAKGTVYIKEMWYTYEQHKWMAIKGFEELYEISDSSVVASIQRRTAIGHLLMRRDLVIKINKSNVRYVVLTKNGKQYRKNLTRLVKEHFK